MTSTPSTVRLGSHRVTGGDARAYGHKLYQCGRTGWPTVLATIQHLDESTAWIIDVGNVCLCSCRNLLACVDSLGLVMFEC